MKPPGRWPDQLSQAGLHIHVNVFVLVAEREGPCGDLRLDGRQAALDGRLVLAGSLTNESFFEGIHLIGSEMELPTSIPSVNNTALGRIGNAFPNPFTDRTSIALDLLTRGRIRTAEERQASERALGADILTATMRDLLATPPSLVLVGRAGRGDLLGRLKNRLGVGPAT